MTYLFLHLIMHLLLFRSHDYLSYINSHRFLLIFCFSLTKGQRSETLDFTIRIGSTPTFLYFDLYQFPFVF